MAGINCGKLDITNINDDDVIAINNKAWVRGDVDEKVYIWDNKACVVIKFNDACTATICNDQTDVNKTLMLLSSAIEVSKESGDGESSPSPPNVDEDSANEEREAKSICGVELDKLKEAQKALDSSSINDRGYQGAAVMPIGAVVPMRSNVRTYGPYASANFGSSAGGVNVEVNTELCPWVFGSITAMHAAGSSLVSNADVGLTRAETGSITIQGLPDLIGLGATVVSGGPNLTGLNVSFGSSGITTNYEFRTYTPKFGGLNRHYLEKFKSIAKNRVEQLRFLRNNQILQNKIRRKLKNIDRNNNKAGGILDKDEGSKNSLQRVLMGEIYNWQNDDGSISQRTVVGTNGLAKSVAEMMYDYEKKAYVSLDALFGPVSLYGDGQLPRYANPNPLEHKKSSIGAQPPFAKYGQCYGSLNLDQYNIDLTQQYLNPLTNNFGDNDHHHTGPGAGHVIDVVGRNSEVPDNGVITNMYSPDDSSRYSNDYRFLAMRGPLVLHSWGYDLDGKPIPNAADDENATKAGTFKTDLLKDQFLKDWLKKPATWPAAPVDLRFDRERGLWVSPQPYKIVVAKIVTKINPFQEGRGVLINYGKKLFDQTGAEIRADGEGECENTEKQEEWVLVNLTDCQEPKYWCCTNGQDEYSNLLYKCVREDDYNFCGAANSVSGPYDTPSCDGGCDGGENYYCCTNGTDEEGNPLYRCLRDNDPAFCGVDNAVGGPYFDDPNCDAGCGPQGSSPSSSSSSSSSSIDLCNPPCAQTITVLTSISLSSGGLVAGTASVRVLDYTPTAPILIAATACSGTGSSSSSSSSMFSGYYCCTNGTDELGNLLYECIADNDRAFCGIANAVSGPYEDPACGGCGVESSSSSSSSSNPWYCVSDNGSVCFCKDDGGQRPEDPLYELESECIAVCCESSSSSSSSSSLPSSSSSSISSSSSSGPEPTPPDGDTQQPMIKLVDRIGKGHNAGELVYAYFDAENNVYIVLQRHKELNTATIYGEFRYGYLQVEGMAGVDPLDNITIGSTIPVFDRLYLQKTEEDCFRKGVAVKFTQSE